MKLLYAYAIPGGAKRVVRRQAGQNPLELLHRLLDGDGPQVAESVGNAGGVGEKVANRHRCPAQRARREQLAHGLIEGQEPAVDGDENGRGGDGFGQRADPEPVARPHRDAQVSVRQAVGLLEHDVVVAPDQDDAAEAGLACSAVEPGSNAVEVGPDSLRRRSPSAATEPDEQGADQNEAG